MKQTEHIKAIMFTSILAAMLIICIITIFTEIGAIDFQMCGTDYNGKNNGVGERFCITSFRVTRG